MNDQSIGSAYYQIKFWKKNPAVKHFFSSSKKSALVLEKILVFVLLEHELKSKFSCERGEEERLIEERRREEK